MLRCSLRSEPPDHQVCQLFKEIIFYLFLINLWTGCIIEDPGNPIDFEVILDSHVSSIDEGIIPEQYLIFQNETDLNNYILEIEQISQNWAENLQRLNYDLMKII